MSARRLSVRIARMCQPADGVAAKYLTDRSRLATVLPMARIREFDTDKAVAQAMELFWERGFEGTSLQDLTEGLAIGRGSLYAAFGSKDGLYQAALERYRQECVGPMLQALSIDADIRGALRGLLTVLVTDAVADERRR